MNHYHSRRLCLCLRRRHCQREHRIAPPPLMMTGVPTRTSTPPLTTTTVLMATIAPMMSTMAPPPPTTNVLTKTSVSHITGCNSRLLSNIWYGRVKTMMQRHRIIQKIYNSEYFSSFRLSVSNLEHTRATSDIRSHRCRFRD